MSWKELKRHPLSAEYSDWSKETQDEVLAQLKANNGLFDGHTIWLDRETGTVVDGMQRLRVSIRADIRPNIKPLPKGTDLVAFVRAMNDCRRHETPEIIAERAAKRRERVAEKLREGKSERQIADEENVSAQTIHRDKEKLTATGVAVEPESGKTTGKDGKEHPASKPKILCGRCSRLGNPVANCESCKEERKAARSGREAGSSEPKPPPSNNGKLLWNWKEHDAIWAKLLRQVDVLGNRFKCKECPEAEALRDGLTKWRADFKELVKKVTKKG